MRVGRRNGNGAEVEAPAVTNIGVQVWPPLMVLNAPPPAVATYTVLPLGSLGSVAMPVMRPAVGAALLLIVGAPLTGPPSGVQLGTTSGALPGLKPWPATSSVLPAMVMFPSSWSELPFCTTTPPVPALTCATATLPVLVPVVTAACNSV